jgi:mono/diheme cytochrome c family protein
MKAVLKALAVLVVLVVLLAVAAFIWIGSRGISARAEPGAIETAVARTMRRLAIPRDARGRQNPVAATPEIIAAGMSHYADHCAACHANDGSGETAIGLGLYPRPPDMRQAMTQELTDGELFYIIENGVRLTGMPAWGTGAPEQAEDTWHLVHFIRRLPLISDAELDRMKAMNPMSPDAVRQQLEEERFLKGETPAPATSSAPHAH